MNNLPPIDRWPTALPIELIGPALRLVEVALHHGNKEEAHAAIERIFADAEPEEVTLDSPLNALRLPQRAVVPLETRGVLTIAALCEWRISDLLALPNFGPAYVRMIEIALEKHGWSLRCDLVTGYSLKTPGGKRDWLNKLYGQKRA